MTIDEDICLCRPYIVKSHRYQGDKFTIVAVCTVVMYNHQR